jgi:hypothetical protein
MSPIVFKMKFQSFAGSKCSVAVATMLVQGLLILIIPITVAAVILRGVLDRPHVSYMDNIVFVKWRSHSLQYKCPVTF